MIEKIKKHWLEVVAGVGLAGALAFYLSGIRAAADRKQELVNRAEDHRAKLEEFAGKQGLPNEETISQVGKEAELVRDMIRQTESYFLSQRRECHTRRFYYSPGAPEPEIIKERYEWLRAYRRKRGELGDPAGGRLLFGLPAWGGSGLPTETWIMRAMVYYWFQKDLIDLFYNREPELLQEYLELRYGGSTMGVSNMYDLVRCRQPNEPRRTLVALARDGKLAIDDLRSILEDLLFSPQGWRVDQALSRYQLRGEEDSTVWDAVERVIVTTEQKQLLNELGGDDDWRTPDNDWRNVRDFAMDIRDVRFHDDLVNVCERLGEDDVVKYFESPATMQEKLRTAISDERNWGVDRLARLISAICAIHTEADYEAVLKNHSTPLIQIANFTLMEVRREPEMMGLEDMGGGPEMYEPGYSPGGLMGAKRPEWRHPFTVIDEMYYPLGFRMTVKIEFQKIPALLRRLFQLDWCVQVRNVTLRQADWTALIGLDKETGAVLPRDASAERYEPAGEFASGEMEGPEETETALRAVPQRVVTLSLQCEGRSFYPLYRDTKGVEEDTTGAPGRPSTEPTGEASNTP